MSAIASSYVWKLSKYRGGARLVLLAIADNADDFGVAWPSVDTIAEKAQLSKRQAQRVLDKLEADRAILIYNRVADGKPEQHYSNVYVLVMPGVEPKLPDLAGNVRRRGVVTPASSGSDIGVTRGSDTDVTRVVTSASSEPSVNHQIEPANTQKTKTAPVTARESAPAHVAHSPPTPEQKAAQFTPEQLEANRQRVQAMLGAVADSKVSTWSKRT